MPAAPLGDTEFDVTLGDRLEEVEVAASRVEDALRQAGATSREIDAVGLAVREAVGNAIRHGNRLEPGKTAALRFRIRARRVEIEVRDQGGGFDRGAVPNPLAPENLLKPSGRGIFLMEKAMDTVDFRFEPEGTVVTLTRQLGGAE